MLRVHLLSASSLHIFMKRVGHYWQNKLCRTLQRKKNNKAVTDDKITKKVVPMSMKTADVYCSCRPSADVKVARG